MIAIRAEADAVGRGEWPADDNPLRQRAAHRRVGHRGGVDARLHARAGRLPGAHARARDKYWPPVRRIDQAYGDRNLVCACPPVEAFA